MNLRFSILAGCFSFLFFSFQEIAAQQSKIDSLTLSLIRQAPEARGTETGALILLKDYRLTIDSAGREILVLRILGKVYTREAMLDYSNIPLGFNSYYEEPILNYARVIHKNGMVTEVMKDAVQIKTTPMEMGLQYTDQRYLSFAIPGMETGAAFDYQVTFNQKTSQIEGEWFDNHWFAGMLQKLSPPYIPRIDPVLTSRLTLLIPSGMNFKYIITKNPVQPVKRSYEGQDEYTWTYQDLPKLTIENSMPDLSTLSPVLLISSVEDWSQIDQWASKTILSKAEVTEEIIAKSKELTTGKRDDYEKIKSISLFIQNNIQYIYADLDRGGFTPHSPREVLMLRYGDCKDQTTLLIALLKAAGIESYPALINPYPYPEFPDWPSPSFAHVIAYIPGKSGDVWLDMTSGSTPFPGIYFPDQGRTAFIINGKGGKLVKTPMPSITENISNYDFQVSFQDTKANISLKLLTNGIQNDLTKSLMKSIDGEMRKEVLRQVIISQAPEAVIDSISFSDIQDPEKNFDVSVKYHIDSAGNKEAMTLGTHAFIPLGLLANIDPKSFPPERVNDLVQTFSYIIKGSEKYTLPDKDLLPVSIPVNDSIVNEFFTFSKNFKSDGNKLIVNWKYSCPSAIIPSEKYNYFLTSIKKLNEQITWNVNFINPMAYVSDVMQSEKREDILAHCNKTLEQDPGNILSLLLRGMLYSETGQPDKSIQDFSKVIKLSPENKYAYTWIAFPHMLKQNQALAIRNLDQAIRLDPEFQEAYFTRAIYWEERNQPDKAVEDLNSALKLNPEYVQAYQFKGTLLLRMDKKAEAIASFKQSLKIDSLNADICSILAETYLNESMYHESIKMYLRAIELEPGKYISYGNLGWAFFLVEDYNKCIEYSKKAIEMNPSAYFAKYNIALANLRSGDVPEAHRLYNELKLQSSSIPADQLRGAVEDLNNMVSEGILVKEAKEILRKYFGIIN